MGFIVSIYKYICKGTRGCVSIDQEGILDPDENRSEHHHDFHNIHWDPKIISNDVAVSTFNH